MPVLVHTVTNITPSQNLISHKKTNGNVICFLVSVICGLLEPYCRPAVVVVRWGDKKRQIIMTVRGDQCDSKSCLTQVNSG